ncbi:MAG: sulfotransferase family protein [Planctomycetota bacterium]|nr:MAG: sulfotransferase family protein [Planctomycetota bacterium]REJ92564.1 MAG: sulfotransferase family protein [Planctomycetota bacterium]REK24989.1 MAG: sulfotransferase family protein [Planctomycetota bacterium]REK30551.1 MAG: sulfotransferase family protein [Planctomycetota bacterium]
MIVVVSGLPRSGTSLMMQMQEAGGLPVLTDNKRKADVHNPRGYYEYETVKRLASDNTWLPEAEGTAVKIVSLLLYELPDDLDYHVIFMRRRLAEVLRSQHRMLAAQSMDGPDDDAMRQHFERHLTELGQWAAVKQNIHWLDVDFQEVITTPSPISQRISQFLGLQLDEQSMAASVHPLLHRQVVEHNNGP